MRRDLWAIFGMVIFAVVYGIDRKVGTLLFAAIVLAMLTGYLGKRGQGIAWEENIPPTVH